MAHKKQHTNPVPPDNQTHQGPPGEVGKTGKTGPAEVASDQAQDPKRRRGDFEGEGEHSFQQPSGKNDANR
jgi:hypothetical protein